MECEATDALITVTLSRTNLRTLLFKLDEPSSAKTLVKSITDSGHALIVQAEEDEVHYKDRPRGIMHPREEAKLNAT